ncbi:hypothetical protein LEMLEM_LOCUS21840 [Lemmus lemmus]
MLLQRLDTLVLLGCSCIVVLTRRL